MSLVSCGWLCVLDSVDALYEQLIQQQMTLQRSDPVEKSTVEQKSGSVEGQTAEQRNGSSEKQSAEHKTDSAESQQTENVQSAVQNTADKQILVRDGVKLNQNPVSKEEAIQAAGELLAKLGYVDKTYVDAMQERERLVSTYMGMGVAIPHGTSQAKGTVRKTGIVLMQYPEGVDFGDEKAQLVFGIAGIGDEHLDLLSKICEMLEDEEILETLKTTNDIDWILERLN